MSNFRGKKLNGCQPDNRIKSSKNAADLPDPIVIRILRLLIMLVKAWQPLYISIVCLSPRPS